MICADLLNFFCLIFSIEKKKIVELHKFDLKKKKKNIPIAINHLICTTTTCDNILLSFFYNFSK